MYYIKDARPHLDTLKTGDLSSMYPLDEVNSFGNIYAVFRLEPICTQFFDVTKVLQVGFINI